MTVEEYMKWETYQSLKADLQKSTSQLDYVRNVIATSMGKGRIEVFCNGRSVTIYSIEIPDIINNVLHTYETFLTKKIESLKNDLNKI
jgi:hypothetical protein